MSYPGPERWNAENEEAFDAVADERLESFARSTARCDGCAAAWEHRDSGGKWCDGCYVPRLEQQLREKDDENKELRRLLEEVGLDRAGIAGELSAVEQQLHEAREALKQIGRQMNAHPEELRRMARAALGEGAKG
jgi:hypothetical protein